MWRQQLTADLQIFVAVVEEEIVGFATGGPIRDPLPPHEAELFAIYLLGACQNQGIGTALLRSVAKSLQAQGFRGMLAWVLEDNASLRFYERSGALRIASKSIEIGGATLPVFAVAWPDLDTLVSRSTTAPAAAPRCESPAR